MGDSDDEDGDAGAPVKNLVASCTELKAGGNEHFKAGRCDEAVTEYWKAVLKLTSGPAKKALAEFYKASPGSPDTASPLLASLHGNMAACHVKSSQWVSAISAASEALRLEPDNLKARRAPRPHAVRMPCTCHAHAVHTPCTRHAHAVRAPVKAVQSSTPHVKARFRRGVACSHVGQNDEAKADLTAVARADPTNREARRVLELVNTALKQHRLSGPLPLT